MHGEFLRLLFLQALKAHFTAAGMSSIATQPIGLVPFQARGILSVTQEQSRPRRLQSGGVEDQPQYRVLGHSGSPRARSLSRSPSHSPPSFFHTIFSPPRSLVRDGQTSPLRSGLVVSRSTCPPLSSPPHANSFVIGPAVINYPPPPREQLCNRYCSNKHTH